MTTLDADTRADARITVPLGFRPWRYYATISAGSIGMAMTAPITAIYAIALGASDSTASLIVSAMVVSFLAIDLTGSRVVSRLDARTALTVGYLVFGVGSFASAVAPNLEAMVAARILQGLAAALPMGAGFRLALRLAATGREAREIARFNMCSFFGLTVGPLIVAAVTSVHAGIAGTDDAAVLAGMRWGFAACAVINVVTAALAWWGLPSIPAAEAPRFGLPPASVFAGRRLRFALLASGLGFSMRTMFGMTLLPLLGIEVGAGISGVATGTTLMAVTELGGIGLSGRLGDRLGRRPVVLGAAVVSTVGLLVAVILPTVVTYFVLCLAMGLGLSALRVVPAAMIVDVADDDEAAAVGWRISCDVSTLVTALVMAAALGAYGLGGGFLTSAGVAVGVGVLAVVIGETRPPPGAAPAERAAREVLSSGAVPGDPA